MIVIIATIDSKTGNIIGNLILFARFYLYEGKVGFNENQNEGQEDC